MARSSAWEHKYQLSSGWEAEIREHVKDYDPHSTRMRKAV